MMQSCASAARLLGGRPILFRGIEAKAQRRVTATSDHLGIASRCKAGSTPNCIGRKRGKSRGGKIIRFPRSDESDSFLEWCRLPILTVYRTLS
jgi:hypothetical protein